MMSSNAGSTMVSSPQKEYHIGDYVILKNREGYIRFIGSREFHHGLWYGIELMIGRGRNDGSEHGQRYFDAEDGKGLFVRESHIKKRMDRSAIDPRRSFLPDPDRCGLPTLPQSATFSDNQSSISTQTPTPTSLNPSPRNTLPLTNTRRDRHKSPPIHRHRDLNHSSRPTLSLRLNHHHSDSSVVHSSRPSSAKSPRMPWHKRSKERPKSTRSSKSRSRSKSPFKTRPKTPRRRRPKTPRSSRPKSPFKSTSHSASSSSSTSRSSTKHGLFGSQSVSSKSKTSKKRSLRSPTSPSFVTVPPGSSSRSRSSRSPRMPLPNQSWQSQRSVTPRNTISAEYDSDVIDDADDDPDSHDSPPTPSHEAYPETNRYAAGGRHLNAFADHEDDEHSRRCRVLTPRAPQTPRARDTVHSEKRFPFGGGSMSSLPAGDGGASPDGAQSHSQGVILPMHRASTVGGTPRHKGKRRGTERKSKRRKKRERSSRSEKGRKSRNRSHRKRKTRRGRGDDDGDGDGDGPSSTGFTVYEEMDSPPRGQKTKSHRSRVVGQEELLTPRGGDGTVYVFQRTTKSRSSSAHSEEHFAEQFLTTDPVLHQRQRAHSRSVHEVEHEEEIHIEQYGNHHLRQRSHFVNGQRRGLMAEGSPRNDDDTTLPHLQSAGSGPLGDAPSQYRFRLHLKKQHTENDRDLYDQGYRIQHGHAVDAHQGHQPIPLRLRQSYSVDSQVSGSQPPRGGPRLSLAVNEGRHGLDQRVDVLPEDFNELPPEYDEQAPMERVHIRRLSSQTSISSNISHVYGLEETAKPSHHAIHDVSPQLAAQHSLQIEHNKLELLQRECKTLDLVPDTPVLSDHERAGAGFDGIEVMTGDVPKSTTSRKSGARKSRSTTPIAVSQISPVFMSRKCTISEMDRTLQSRPHSTRASNSTRASARRLENQQSMEIKRQNSDPTGSQTQNVLINARNASSDGSDDELRFLTRSNKMDDEEEDEVKASGVGSEERANGRGTGKYGARPIVSYDIDESVIEYHVPSVSKRKNQNIKINIHINNDIINGKVKKSKSTADRNRRQDRQQIAIARAHSADYADLDSADSGDTIEEEHYHQHNLTVHVPKSPRASSGDREKQRQRGLSPRAKSARASVREVRGPMMFRSESTHVEARSSSRDTFDDGYDDEMAAPNAMIKAFSMGTSSTSNVTPQPSSLRKLKNRRQSSNPFMGRPTHRMGSKKRAKKKLSDKSKSRRKREVDDCRNEERCHRSSEEEHSSSSKKRGCSCAKHRKLEKEARRSRKKVKVKGKEKEKMKMKMKMKTKTKGKGDGNERVKGNVKGKGKEKEKRSKRERKEKEKERKRLKQQIKFRRKMVQRAYTPRNPVPPVPSPRGVAVERLNAVKSFEWTV